MKRYAFSIELNYLGQPYDICRIIWLELRERMIEAGFRCEGRLFTIAVPHAEAVQHARSVLESISDDMALPEGNIYAYVRDFYCFDHTTYLNLLYPTLDQPGFRLEEG